MDIATITGIVSAFGLVLTSMALGPGVMAFVNVPSVLIVVCGTVGATLIAYPLTEVFGVGGVVMNAFTYKLQNPQVVIPQLVDFAGKARRDGILALEAAAAEIDDAFTSRGIQLAVDGQEPDAIEGIMQTEIDKVRGRHKKGVDILTTMGTFAPALGLIGTLIGLIGMLQNMSDPSSIGPAMAVALLTTLYGAILAFVLFAPIASKLETRTKVEVAHKTLAIIGVESILKGDNSMVIQSKLDAYLSPADREAKAAEK